MFPLGKYCSLFRLLRGRLISEQQSSAAGWLAKGTSADLRLRCWEEERVIPASQEMCKYGLRVPSHAQRVSALIHLMCRAVTDQRLSCFQEKLPVSSLTCLPVDCLAEPLSASFIVLLLYFQVSGGPSVLNPSSSPLSKHHPPALKVYP